MNNLGQLAGALAKAQAEIKPAVMDSDNPFFKSRYSSLSAIWDACRASLAANGLAVVQLPTNDGESVTITTMLIHESGERISAKTSAPIGDGKNKVQAMGSTITYLRRYALAAMVGVVSDEDDDGNGQPAPQQKPAARTYGSPETFFKRVQDGTSGYYKNVHHLKNTIGEWPDWTDKEAVIVAGKLAIEHAQEKQSLGDENAEPPASLFDEAANGGAAYAE